MTVAIRLAVDAMGGDFGPRVVVPAVHDILLRHPQLEVQLYGDQAEIQKYLTNFSDDLTSRLHIHHSLESITMADSISVALRQKKQSSMRLALEAVKHKQADACVSAGNTGALMATAKFVLKTILFLSPSNSKTIFLIVSVMIVVVSGCTNFMVDGSFSLAKNHQLLPAIIIVNKRIPR